MTTKIYSGIGDKKSSYKINIASLFIKQGKNGGGGKGS